MTKSLQSIIPLSLALFALLGYQFLGANWSAAPANPPDNNTSPPIHTGFNNGVGDVSTQNIEGTLGIDTLRVFLNSELNGNLRLDGQLNYRAGLDFVAGERVIPGEIMVAGDEWGRMEWRDPLTLSAEFSQFNSIFLGFPDAIVCRENTDHPSEAAYSSVFKPVSRLDYPDGSGKITYKGIVFSTGFYESSFIDFEFVYDLNGEALTHTLGTGPLSDTDCDKQSLAELEASGNVKYFGL